MKKITVTILCLVILLGVSVNAQTRRGQTKRRAPEQAKRTTIVDEVLQLLKAGVSEDIILTKAKQGGTTSLTTDQIVGLKGAGASDRIIRTMMGQPEPQSQTTAKQVATEQKHEVTLPTAPAVGNVNTNVSEVGFYLMNGNTPVQMEATAFGQQKTRALNGIAHGLTFGIKKLKQIAVLNGAAAALRTNNKKPEFVFYAPEGGSPSEFVIIKLEKKETTREITAASLSLLTGAKGGFATEKMVKFSHTKVAPRKYVITFTQALEPGEYAFYPTSSGQASGIAVAVSGRLYDFGVDY